MSDSRESGKGCVPVGSGSASKIIGVIEVDHEEDIKQANCVKAVCWNKSAASDGDAS